MTTEKQKLVNNNIYQLIPINSNMKTQQAITGTAVIFFGLFIALVTIVETLITLIYAIPIIIIGIVILLNKKEDIIEKIKKIK